jgi:hypothetical protein
MPANRIAPPFHLAPRALNGTQPSERRLPPDLRQHSRGFFAALRFAAYSWLTSSIVVEPM